MTPFPVLALLALTSSSSAYLPGGGNTIIHATMDVTIPPHNLKRFTASLTCLSKIGKDLYVSFDPFDGLTLSSLNEAKSAYGKFHFDCGFFERCLGVATKRGARNNHEDDESSDEGQWRYVCRVPVRSVHAVLRPRKGVLSLRIRSEGTDESGHHLGVNQREGHRSESRQSGEPRQENVPYSTRRRKRKKNQETDEHDDSPSSRNDKMMLTFEYHIERPPIKTPQSSSAPITSTFQVKHKVAVTDAQGITLSTSTHRKTRSEIIAPPKLWMRLLDPLKQTQEVALTIDDELKVVTATSFHPSHTGQNAVLAASRNAVLKTETSTGVEEFDEYDFRNNRFKNRNDLEFEEEEERPPEDVNQRVILVFSIKEAKAMLQFCSQTNSTHHNDGEALSILSFHWGGRPIVLETDGDFFSAELVLATLHHGMIASNIMGNKRVEVEGAEN
ncbi:hypothetical protein HJC23_010004 [Cyclotella cryptica]|uniref:Uncharacterized protein n=1 Tax=Cyclotella cryptica TaxID=29204 RepID=A0ABD3Q8C1_9STRA|eukprot:CCRYP_007781-RB/>CCRYP_007781-RB protein AED:0.06 eAED:0.06 QI:12/1/1/1/0.25/0.2/5/849/443